MLVLICAFNLIPTRERDRTALSSSMKAVVKQWSYQVTPTAPPIYLYLRSRRCYVQIWNFQLHLKSAWKYCHSVSGFIKLRRNTERNLINPCSGKVLRKVLVLVCYPGVYDRTRTAMRMTGGRVQGWFPYFPVLGGGRQLLPCGYL